MAWFEVAAHNAHMATNPETNTPSVRPATREDLEALPDDVVGEIIDGTLYTSPRPRMRHMLVATAISDALFGPFSSARGGPGGWWIVVEPGIELPNAPEISPDVAGWKRESMPELPEVARVVPDWVCEILSPSTRWLDLKKKRPYYARIGVQHMWLVDPATQTLTVSRNVNGQWTEVGLFVGEEKIRAEPFGAVEIDLAYWWQTKA